jgi:hypothetical protein
LSLAKKLIQIAKLESTASRLKALADEYPDTEESKTAQQMLIAMKGE